MTKADALPPLSPRLRAVAEWVRAGANAADIGADHAYLAVYLVKTGHCPRCAACDVRSGPLERARRTVERYGAQALVPLRLCDGLDGLSPQEADDVILAGMGGELIARLVTRCAWLRDGQKRLVLQPMTAQTELRRALCAAGFEILRETAVREGAKLYVVMSAAYSGRVWEPDALFSTAGLLAQSGEPAARDWLLRQAALLRKKAAGMRRAERLAGQAQPHEALAGRLEALADSMKER